MSRNSYRRPVWPAFVFERCSQAGVAELEREYEDFKTARRLPRVTRCSAEDFATVVVNNWIATGRAEFLKRAA